MGMAKKSLAWISPSKVFNYRPIRDMIEEETPNIFSFLSRAKKQWLGDIWILRVIIDAMPVYIEL
jgi:hypothetical protein